jgi:hypothetical protein
MLIDQVTALIPKDLYSDPVILAILNDRRLSVEARKAFVILYAEALETRALLKKVTAND